MSQHVLIINDAEAARQALARIDLSSASRIELVACAPHLTQRIGRFVAHSQREKWRTQWCAKLFDAVLPALKGREGVTTSIAKQPLPEVIRQLRLRMGADLQVHDARRAPMGAAIEPLDTQATTEGTQRWVAPVAVTSSLSVVLALVD